MTVLVLDEVLAALLNVLDVALFLVVADVAGVVVVVTAVDAVVAKCNHLTFQSTSTSIR
jgi:hypothetical protein